MGTFDKKVNTNASAARTASGQGNAISSENARTLSILVDVTAVSGTTPNLVFAVEWSHDNGTWFPGDPPDTMTAITAVGRAAKAFTVKAPYWRLVWTITGTTPSFTFASHAYLT